MRTVALIFSQAGTAGGAASIAGADPWQALFSAAGGATVASVLLLWVRSEKDGRKEERAERQSVGTHMLSLYEKDTEHKQAIRLRLDEHGRQLERILTAVSARGS